MIGGVLLLMVRPATLNRLILALTQHELIEDPHDRIATGLRQTATQLSVSTQLFGSIYLIAHGLLKLLIVAGLWRGYRWAIPWSLPPCPYSSPTKSIA